MDADFKNNPRISEQEESENTQESGPDSPPSILFNDTKAASTSCPKRSKRGLQKRVVSVPIKDVEGSRLKGDNATPPSDSWAWRKYGQKPIKGSPYPRGYYRCSSSKGCPARKQVERSKVDPSMLVVTYSFEHNHPSPPPSRTNHHHHHHHHNNASSSSSSSSTGTQKPETETETDVIKTESPEPEPENDFTTHIAGDETLITIEEFAWFGNIDHYDDQTTTTSSTILESPIIAEERSAADVSFFPKMREEDESLFADLGELPECSSVFRRHRGLGPQVQIC